MGNIKADSNGVADFELEVPNTAVVPGTFLFGKNSIVGHTLVIHAKEDKFTQPTGDAGSRLVCGLIYRE